MSSGQAKEPCTSFRHWQEDQTNPLCVDQGRAQKKNIGFDAIADESSAALLPTESRGDDFFFDRGASKRRNFRFFRDLVVFDQSFFMELRENI
jgi:hypothetical protein